MKDQASDEKEIQVSGTYGIDNKPGSFTGTVSLERENSIYYN